MGTALTEGVYATNTMTVVMGLMRIYPAVVTHVSLHLEPVCVSLQMDTTTQIQSAGGVPSPDTLDTGAMMERVSTGGKYVMDDHSVKMILMRSIVLSTCVRQMS